MGHNRWYRQGGGNAMPTPEGNQQEIWAEIRKLWMKLREQKDIDITPKEVVWSYSGIVNPFEDKDGQRWPAIYNLRLASVILTLQDASSQDVNVEVFGNDGYYRSLVLGAGRTSSVFGINLFFPSGTEMWPRVKALPTGNGTQLGIIFRYLAADS